MRRFFVLPALLACAAPPTSPRTEALVAPGPAGGVVATPPHGYGAVVYVPAWSSVYIAEGDKTFDLTVTLSVRNTDRAHPITVTRVDFHDATGGLVHAYAPTPVALDPLASAEIVVRESDRRAGVGGSFLVEWRAADDVSEPLVQAVMVGAGAQQGISFVTDGRVVARTTPAPAIAP